MSNFLTKDQVYELNEKYGYFEFGDAQADKSNEFAKDVVIKYKAMQEAAPELYEALVMVLNASQEDISGGFLNVDEVQLIASALTKASGKGE